VQNYLNDEFSHPIGEHRISVRYQFSADIEIEWCSKKIWGHVLNISRSGMFIEIPNLPVLNAMFPAKLALNQPLQLECVVRRIVPRYGIGVTIAIRGEQDRRRFEALLFALSEGAGPASANVSLPPPGEPQEPLAAVMSAGRRWF
jgi:hypothetical protein